MKAEQRTIGGFICTATPESLRVSCISARDGSSVGLIFGPGGEGLADCGQSPVTKDAQLAWVRAGGIGCNSARRAIFAAFASGEPTDVPGYSCKEGLIAGVATVSCSGSNGELAFTAPNS